MQEWQPLTRYKSPWITDVDLYVCPMTYTFHKFKSRLPCLSFVWPVDTRLFPFHPRRQFSKFLFVNGNGGWHGRKGSDTLARALHLWPEMPVTIYSQTNVPSDLISNLPRYPNAKLAREVPTPADLYSSGEMLLCPHTVDGLCLQPREAAACGIPNITTHGPIWEDFPKYATISSTRQSVVIREPVEIFIPDPASLVEEAKKCVDHDFTAESYSVREWAESKSWDLLKDQLLDVIISGKPFTL
jgi:glycosyltransferase involved in cell wall biosynthesis